MELFQSSKVSPPTFVGLTSRLLISMKLFSVDAMKAGRGVVAPTDPAPNWVTSVIRRAGLVLTANREFNCEDWLAQTCDGLAEAVPAINSVRDRVAVALFIQPVVEFVPVTV